MVIFYHFSPGSYMESPNTHYVHNVHYVHNAHHDHNVHNVHVVDCLCLASPLNSQLQQQQPKRVRHDHC